MSVRAKFYVSSITRSHPEAPAAQINMGAVCRGAANSEWASATPSGSLVMTVRNDAAIAQFVQGKEYYLTFTEAEPKVVPEDGHTYELGTTPWGQECCKACGAVGTWVPDTDQANHPGRYVWDDTAQARHDEMYAKK